MKYYLVAFFTFIFFQTTAQKLFQYDDQINVRTAEQSLLMPFAGGINAAQLQEIDVNGDGRQELVVWDKNAANLIVFEQKERHYVHRPEWSYYFPSDINGFLVLADYDGDGRKDIFTSSPFGIKVYRNRSTGSEVQWEVAQDFLRLDNRSNLQMNNLDIPAILDLDGDGDLDIVTFNFASGDFLEFYQNTSVERKGSPDVDGFAPAVTRWGSFEFCGCDNFSFGQTCAGRPIALAPTWENLKVAHAGGHSLLLHDFNGDGILDMLMGQDECNSLYYLVNEGTNSEPLFRTFAKELPQWGALPAFPIFHAAYMLGEELVISTNSPAASSQFKADYARNLYRYSKDKQLLSTAFLQEDMIDLGENTRPFYKGSAQSGDLIVTANSLVDGEVVGKAYHFSFSTEGLILEEEDYLNLSSLGLIDLQYQEFLNTEGRRTLFVSGVEIINFTAVRKLYWSDDVEESELHELALPEVQLRGNDHLEFYRHNGENYLLVARQTGELIHYRVGFGAVPQMELMDRDYLGFGDDPSHRNLSVHVASSGDKLNLYTIDQRGMMDYIPDFTQQESAVGVRMQLSDSQSTPTRLGRNTWITSVPSGFSDRTDLILGNTSGGLIYLKDISPDSGASDQEELQLKIYPNPAVGPVSILASSSGTITLINTLGQVLMQDIQVSQGQPFLLDLRSMSSGVYIVQLVGNNGKRISKKLIVHKM